MTLVFTQFPAAGASIYVGEATSSSPSTITYETTFTMPPSSGSVYMVNISCEACYPSTASPVVYVGYADDTSSRKKISASTSCVLVNGQLEIKDNILYVEGSVTNIVVGGTYIVELICNSPKTIWSASFKATWTTQSFNYQASPLTCSSARYIIARTPDWTQGSYN